MRGLFSAALIGEALADRLKDGRSAANSGGNFGGFVDAARCLVDIDPERGGGVFQQEGERLELPEKREKLLAGESANSATPAFRVAIVSVRPVSVSGVRMTSIRWCFMAVVSFA